MESSRCRLQALKEKIAEQKKHLDALDANVYVNPWLLANCEILQGRAHGC